MMRGAEKYLAALVTKDTKLSTMLFNDGIQVCMMITPKKLRAAVKRLGLTHTNPTVYSYLPSINAIGV